MPTDVAKYIWDAKVAAERIARFTSAKSFTDYQRDDLLRSGVERQFEIIGEAFAALRREAPDVAVTVPDLPRIVAFRNVLIHGYASVDDRLVWGVVETDLPSLITTLDRLLAERGEP
jgi:uncharacterized protein with HEPN domain